jgi:phosphomannomutase
MTSVSGIRGIVGESLTPEIIIKFITAFAQKLKGGKVVVGGDPRTSSRFIKPLVKGALMACGCSPIDIHYAPTPTVEIAVKKLSAAGGIAITASHNPQEWNGLKFIGSDGMFIPENEMFSLIKDAETPKQNYARWEDIGDEEEYLKAVDDHLQLIYDLTYIDVSKIKKRKFKVAIDCVNGAGAIIVPKLLKKFGCDVIELYKTYQMQ